MEHKLFRNINIWIYFHWSFEFWVNISWFYSSLLLQPYPQQVRQSFLAITLGKAPNTTTGLKLQVTPLNWLLHMMDNTQYLWNFFLCILTCADLLIFVCYPHFFPIFSTGLHSFFLSFCEPTLLSRSLRVTSYYFMLSTFSDIKILVSVFFK